MCDLRIFSRVSLYDINGEKFLKKTFLKKYIKELAEHLNKQVVYHVHWYEDSILEGSQVPKLSTDSM